MPDQSLSADEAAQILAAKSTRKAGKPTEPRELKVWFKLDHMINPDGCSNPNCVDTTRPQSDPGRQIVYKMDNEFICRECFLAGWLSDASRAS